VGWPAFKISVLLSKNIFVCKQTGDFTKGSLCGMREKCGFARGALFFPACRQAGVSFSFGQAKENERERKIGPC